MLKTVYRSSCRDKHNCQRRDSNLDPLTPQSDAPTTRPLRPAKRPEEGNERRNGRYKRIRRGDEGEGSVGRDGVSDDGLAPPRLQTCCSHFGVVSMGFCLVTWILQRLRSRRYFWKHVLVHDCVRFDEIMFLLLSSFAMFSFTIFTHTHTQTHTHIIPLNLTPMGKGSGSGT